MTGSESVVQRLAIALDNCLEDCHLGKISLMTVGVNLLFPVTEFVKKSRNQTSPSLGVDQAVR
jgi:hypothetical protein